MTCKKHRGGGVALRATFAALIALGSIPCAAVISPNFSSVAFAATRSSDDTDQDPQDLKSASINAIKALTNLDENAKKPFLDRVDNALTAEDVNKAVADAKLADAKAALKKVINAADKKMHDVAYTKATREKRQAFEEKLLIAFHASVESHSAVDSLNKARTDLEAAMNAFDSKARDLAEKKAAAKQTINDLKNLGIQDKKNYCTQVDHAADEADVNRAIANAKFTDDTYALKKVIDEARVKSNGVAYTSATQEKQQAFIEKLNAAVRVYEETFLHGHDDSQLNKARTELERAMNALDGELQPQKTEAIDAINALTNLDKNAKKPFLDRVRDAQTEEDVNKAVADAKLADARLALKKVIDAADAKKNDVAYTKATRIRQLDFDRELNAAKYAYTNFPQSTGLKTFGAELERVMGALDGELQALKAAAKQTINDLKNLEQQDKTTYCDQVEQATDEDSVNVYVSSARYTDARAALKKVIDAANTKKSDVAYTKATPEKKQAFDGYLRNARRFYDDPSSGVILINESIRYLTDAMNALDGELQVLKAAAKQTINALENLKQQDKTTYCGKVDQVSDENGVNKVVADAKLGDARLALDKVINAAYAKRNEVAYKKATPEKKQAFEGKIDAAFEVSMQDADSLNKARTDLEDAMNALDGELQAAKSEAISAINSLTNLDENAKKPFLDRVRNAKTAIAVRGSVLDAQRADAKAALEKVITEANTKKNDVAYTKATDEKKQAFDEKLRFAISLGEGFNSPSLVNKAGIELERAMNALDGKADTPQPQDQTYPYYVENITESEDAHATTTSYRLYNTWTHEHLFTTDKNEYDMLVSAGWTAEESAGKVAVKQGKGVYRLYNPTTGEHHYTTDEDEVAACVKAGWVNEGIHFYSVKNGNVPVYSMYNPYEKKFYHHYTSDPDEIARMVNDGWINEGIKWYEAK